MARISPGTMTAAIFAILVGLGGAFAVRQYMYQPQVAAPQAEQSLVVVPVAARDLQAGQTLTLNDVLVHKMTPEKFRSSDFSSVLFMRNTQQISGRILNAELKKGQVFQPTDFYSDGMGPGVAERLKPGYRAVSVPIEDIGAVGGFALPGSIVDVLFRSEMKDDYPEMTLTLLERVEVLALDQSVLPGKRVDESTGRAAETTMVTLAVTPGQAKALKVVEGRGELSLALRNPSEAEDELISLNLKRTSSRVTLDQLLGPSRRKTQMEIYRGGEKEVLEFEVSGNEDQYDETLINTPIAADAPSLVEPVFKPMPLSSFPSTRQISREN